MKSKTTTVALTLASLLGAVSAHADGHTFTPLENLPPEQRIELTQQLNAMTDGINIDWDEIVAGVDENGKLTLLPKSQVSQASISSPSSFSAK